MKHEPADWGKDRLTDFFSAADANIRATFVRKKSWTRRLIGINDIFHDAQAVAGAESAVIPALLMSRSHHAYLAACRLGFSAQCSDSYPLSRSCLESALTGHYLAVKPELSEVWFRRHKGPDELKRCRQAFSYARLINCLKVADGNLGRLTDKLYQSAIDMGAHPNERAVTANLRIFEDGDEVVYRINSLHSDGPILDVCLKAIASVGIAALRIRERVFPEEFLKLGLTARINELSAGL